MLEQYPVEFGSQNTYLVIQTTKKHKLSNFGPKMLNFDYFHNINRQIFKYLPSPLKLT